jgi:hypothetical protein
VVRPVEDPESPQIPDLTRLVIGALRRARDRLLARMADSGLDAERGWRVKEELRESLGGTEWVLSPIHLREPSPELEERVRIDESGRLVAEPD